MLKSLQGNTQKDERRGYGSFFLEKESTHSIFRVATCVFGVKKKARPSLPGNTKKTKEEVNTGVFSRESTHSIFMVLQRVCSA